MQKVIFLNIDYELSKYRTKKAELRYTTWKVSLKSLHSKDFREWVLALFFQNYFILVVFDNANLTSRVR